MKTAICPGSFDPVTLGHMDIIRRSAKLFDHVIVVVMRNYHKSSSAFTPEERVELLRRCTRGMPNVEVDTYMGLLADYAREKRPMPSSRACALSPILRTSSSRH